LPQGPVGEVVCKVRIEYSSLVILQHTQLRAFQHPVWIYF
jgi:hypothetical protein